jgi:hypothetical protein
MKWFKHDSNSNRDSKLEKILMKYGADGYALYWLCLELIAEPIEKNKISFELEHDAEILAFRLKIDSQRVEEIMKYMIALELFEHSAESERITCFKLASRIENSIVKSPQLKEIQDNIKESGIIPDNPGRLEITSDLSGQSGKTRARIDIDKNREELDIEEEYKKEQKKKSPFEQWKPQQSPASKTDESINYWNSIPGLPKTRKLTINLGEKAKPIIESVKLYSLDEIKKAIDNYAKIIGNDQRYKPIARYGDVFGFLSTGIDKYWDEAKPLDLMLLPGSRGIVKSDLTPEEAQAEADALWGN